MIDFAAKVLYFFVISKFFSNFATMNLNRIIFTSLISFFLAFPLYANDDGDLTAVEQQQVSAETPGLFSKSSSFKIDFSQIKSDEYAFPLPVGKVENIKTSGFDIVTKKGDNVKAMMPGIVRLSRNTSQYGNVIVVRHDNGLETMYAHNGSNVAKVGQRVKAGQTIALAGGDGSRVYCQFAIMVNGCKINPQTILDVENHKLLSETVIFRKKGHGVSVSVDRKKNKAENKEEGGEESVDEASESSNPFGGNAVYRIDLSKIQQWRYPLDDDAHVISGYGGGRHHSGTDIKNSPNRDIYAAFDGVVVQAGPYSGYGKCITIRHAFGIETRYSHNAKNYVSVGDHVKAGDVIGTTGRTGRATTEHLHFETRIAGRAFDSAYVFDHSNHALRQDVLQFKKNGRVVRLK